MSHARGVLKITTAFYRNTKNIEFSNARKMFIIYSNISIQNNFKGQLKMSAQKAWRTFSCLRMLCWMTIGRELRSGKLTRKDCHCRLSNGLLGTSVIKYATSPPEQPCKAGYLPLLSPSDRTLAALLLRPHQLTPRGHQEDWAQTLEQTLNHRD